MFFRKQLTLEKPVLFESNKERIININTISLESSDDSKLPIEIYCENKRKKESYKVCSLKKGSNELYSINLFLDIHNSKDKFEIKLQTKSKNVVVNLIGFYEEEEEEDEEELREASKKIDRTKEIEKKKDNEIKEIKNKEKDKIKENKNKEEKKEEKDKEKIKEKDNKEKEILKEEKEDSKSESGSVSDDIDNEVLEDNGPSVSLVELLNKKRKEEPQDLKPITLKNLVSSDKTSKVDSKNKKKKIDNKLKVKK